MCRRVREHTAMQALHHTSNYNNTLQGRMCYQVKKTHLAMLVSVKSLKMKSEEAEKTIKTFLEWKLFSRDNS